MRTTTISAILSFAVLAGVPAAQGLRHAVVEADLVVLAVDAGVRPAGKHVMLHRLQVKSVLKGKHVPSATVVDVTNLSAHQRPRPAELRIYCLHDFSKGAREIGLPSRHAPYFKMSGHIGSNPRVSDPEKSAAIGLVRTILRSEAGDSPKEITADLLKLALNGPPVIRTEAVDAITDRPALRDSIVPLQDSALMSRAVGETRDIRFKTALVNLCAQRKVEGLINALCMSAGAVSDLTFWETVGRIAGRMHGEAAVDILRPHVARIRTPDVRGRLLVALGATSTEGALDALLRMRAARGADKYVDAALRSHGSKRALEAVKPPRK